MTLDPALRMLFARYKPLKNRVLSAIVVGKYYAEEQHPISRLLFKLYDKPCRFVLRWPKATSDGSPGWAISAIRRCSVSSRRSAAGGRS